MTTRLPQRRIARLTATAGLVSLGGIALSLAGTSQAQAKTLSYKGSVDTNRWGPVEAVITVSGGRIVGVRIPVSPNHTNRSVQINNRAIPLLKAETLSAQSARVQNVSGATYTVISYQHSLQSAIDKAKSAGAL